MSRGPGKATTPVRSAASDWQTFLGATDSLLVGESGARIRPPQSLGRAGNRGLYLDKPAFASDFRPLPYVFGLPSSPLPIHALRHALPGFRFALPPCPLPLKQHLHNSSAACPSIGAVAGRWPRVTATRHQQLHCPSGIRSGQTIRAQLTRHWPFRVVAQGHARAPAGWSSPPECRRNRSPPTGLNPSSTGIRDTPEAPSPADSAWHQGALPDRTPQGSCAYADVWGTRTGRRL